MNDVNFLNGVSDTMHGDMVQVVYDGIDIGLRIPIFEDFLYNVEFVSISSSTLEFMDNIEIL